MKKLFFTVTVVVCCVYSTYAFKTGAEDLLYFGNRSANTLIAANTSLPSDIIGVYFNGRDYVSVGRETVCIVIDGNRVDYDITHFERNPAGGYGVTIKPRTGGTLNPQYGESESITIYRDRTLWYDSNSYAKKS